MFLVEGSEDYLLNGSEFRRDGCFFFTRLAWFVKNVVLYIKTVLGCVYDLVCIGAS